MKGRSRIPKILLTFLGIGIPSSFVLPFAWSTVSLRHEQQVVLGCSAISVGSFLLSWAMWLHERRCCCTSKMICSWVLFSVIVVSCICILFVEFTDIWASDITTEDREKWSSIGFALAGSLMLVSFLLNWFYLCKCIGSEKAIQRRKRSSREHSRKKRRGSRRINGFHQSRHSSRRSLSHSQSKRKRKRGSERTRSRSASAVVARVSYDPRIGSKKNTHIVEMNSGWLDRSSRNRNRSSSRSARKLRLHSMAGRSLSR